MTSSPIPLPEFRPGSRVYLIETEFSPLQLAGCECTIVSPGQFMTRFGKWKGPPGFVYVVYAATLTTQVHELELIRICSSKQAIR